MQHPVQRATRNRGSGRRLCESGQTLREGQFTHAGEQVCNIQIDGGYQSHWEMKWALSSWTATWYSALCIVLAVIRGVTQYPCTDKTLRKWQSDMNSDKCWRDLLKQGVQNKCLERWIPGLFEMCHSTCSLWWFQFVICTSQCNSSCTSSMLWSSDQGHCSNQGPFPELLVLGKGYSDCWGFDRPYFNCNLLSFRTWPKPLVGLGRQGYSLGIRLMDSGYGCEWSLWL